MISLEIVNAAIVLQLAAQTTKAAREVNVAVIVIVTGGKRDIAVCDEIADIFKRPVKDRGKDIHFVFAIVRHTELKCGVTLGAGG